MNEGLSANDYKIALISAFFHDIGKEGDCIYDMYSNKIYGGVGDWAHLDYSRDILLNIASHLTII